MLYKSIRTILVALGLLAAFGTLRVSANPVTYQFTDGFGSGTFDIDIPALGGKENTYTATNLNGGSLTLGQTWFSIYFSPSEITFFTVIYSAGFTSSWFGGIPGSSANEAWNNFVDAMGPNLQRVPSSSVPDTGSTIALVGAALLGLAALRRRFAT